MTTLAPSIDAPAVPRARAVRVGEDSLILELADGRSLSAPLAWYPRLLAGSAAERARLELIGEGVGVHWPDLDEDLSVESVLIGRSSSGSLESFRRWLSARTLRESTARSDAPENGGMIVCAGSLPSLPPAPGLDRWSLYRRQLSEMHTFARAVLFQTATG